jgi:hypothetical protein
VWTDFARIRRHADASTCATTCGVGQEAEKEKRRKEKADNPDRCPGVFTEGKNGSKEGHGREQNHPSQHLLFSFGEFPQILKWQVEDHPRSPLF